MGKMWVAGLVFGGFLPFVAVGEPEHSHPVPGKLGTVHFETTCAPAVQADFDRGVALLHSFAYEAASEQFKAVASQDAACAMAHWGVAMSLYHQLWSPPSVAQLREGQQALVAARKAGTARLSERESELLYAIGRYFSDADPAHHARRAGEYAEALQAVARRHPQDEEIQIFHALALISIASPSDRQHVHQKQALAILEPLYQRLPDHPGVAHYLIHACDSTELAPRGLAAARAYAKIAPAAPHALHMPSHIFTRLGLWDDSIASNEAARQAAHAQHDTGEELHAMDYLTYAYLQQGRQADARQVVADLRGMGSLVGGEFKVGYAATAMPVRLALEGDVREEALTLSALPGSAPQVAALVYWAKALAHAQAHELKAAQEQVRQLETCETQARSRGDDYWATQIHVLKEEASAWIDEAAGQADKAVQTLRTAADAEDGLEKLPVTPGPVVPAREQLGRMLLQLHRPREALVELRQALRDAPGRRAGQDALAQAAREAGESRGDPH